MVKVDNSKDIGRLEGMVESIRERIGDYREDFKSVFLRFENLEYKQIELESTLENIVHIVEKSSISIKNLEDNVIEDVRELKRLKKGLFDKLLDFLRTSSGKIVLGVIAVFILGVGTVVNLLQSLKDF